MIQPLGKTSGSRTLLRWVARTGYAARGTVYILTGLVAALTAGGFRHQSNDSQGALLLVQDSPFGDVLLVALAAGLFAYAVWSLLRALFDPEGECLSPREWMRRVGFFFTSICYCGLVVLAIQVLTGRAEKNQGDRSARHWTAKLMAFPLGRWAVAGVGIGFLVYVASEFFRSRRALAHDPLVINHRSRRWVDAMIQFGIISRAIVFAVIGLFFVVAAIRYDTHQVEGLNGAFRVLSHEPAGRFLLAFVAAGFIAYGTYDLILSRYRVIQFRR